MTHRRAGSGLAEAIAATVVAGFLLASATSAIFVQIRVAHRVVRSAEETDALGTAHAVLHVELRDAIAADRPVLTSDSIALRAFRGSAIICAAASGRATIRYRGSRAPDAAKDSVIVLGRSGERAAAFAVSLPARECLVPAAEATMAVSVTGSVRPGDVLLFFERGAYHLSGRALRWRVGAAGRQPLTPDVFETDANEAPAETFEWILRLAADRGPPLRLALRSLHGEGEP